MEAKSNPWIAYKTAVLPSANNTQPGQTASKKKRIIEGITLERDGIQVFQ